MIYPPIKSGGGRGQKSVQGNMPVFGVNLQDDSQLLDTRSALRIENYLVHGTAKMQKRPGQIVNFDTSDANPIPLCEEYVNDFDIVAYGQKVRAYNNADGTFTNIKTDFTANNSGFSGGRYGDYFFVNNLQDGLWRIGRTLAYDAQSGNFTVGLKVTGATSGAYGYILQDADAGATGILTLGGIVGVFADNEIITDSATGSATVNGTLSFSITNVSNAPKANVFRIIGKRAILVNLATDQSGYNYSNADTGVNPPFNTWATASGYDSPGAGSYRAGGAAMDVAMIGDIIFIGQSNGWYAFSIQQTDISGVSSKYDKDEGSRKDFPVYRAVTTNAGMFVVTSSGIKRLVSLGQSNVPFSDQWEDLTNELGEDYFTDVNFDSTDIMFDEARGFVYATAGKDSETNNLIFAVKINTSSNNSSVKSGATSFLTGWNVLRFMKRNNMIYGTSALDGIRHELFVGQKDVDAKIYSQYVQELNFAFTEGFDFEEFYAKAELSPASELIVSFDTYDLTGYYTQQRWISEAWVPRYSYTSDSSQWGEAGFGQDGFGGGSTQSGLVSDRTGAKPKMRRINRVILRVESNDYGEHIFNWFSATVRVTRQIRDRRLTKATT